jgi:DNA-binding NtrC family response regulator
MNHPYLLIVHPDKSSRALLRCMLEGLNYRIAEAAGYRVGVGMLGRDPDALVLAGADAGDPEASEFLTSVKRRQPPVPFILLLSGEAPDLANQALRYGAASVLRFPSPTTQVRAAVVHALSRTARPGPSSPRGVPHPAVATAATRPIEAAFLGEDAGLRQALDLARAIAPLPSLVLIVGEAGCGKSLLARVIHELSPRHNGPFVEIGCLPREDATVDETLFGNGADSGGSERERRGKVVQAHGGTLVLEDVNTLTPIQQLKLFMTLKEGRPVVGGLVRPGRLDVRLILTSRSDDGANAVPGRFWQHLYTQNSCTTLRLPPLKERGTDVILLAEHFLARAAREPGRSGIGLAPDALEALRQYPWPGNVTELKTVIHKALAHCHGARIGPIHLGLTAGKEAAAAVALKKRARWCRTGPDIRILPLREALAEPEKWLVLRALQARDWNRQEAADALLINRATLEKKMKKFGLYSGEGQSCVPNP